MHRFARMACNVLPAVHVLVRTEFVIVRWSMIKSAHATGTASFQNQSNKKSYGQSHSFFILIYQTLSKCSYLLVEPVVIRREQ